MCAQTSFIQELRFAACQAPGHANLKEDRVKNGAAASLQRSKLLENGMGRDFFFDSSIDIASSLLTLSK